MEASDEFRTQQQKIQAALVAVNRTVNSITAEDLPFQRTVNPEVASQLDANAARLLRLTNGLLRASALATGRKPSATVSAAAAAAAVPVLEDTEDVELHWKGVVDVIDALLEKADTSLDEYTGLLKRKDAPTTEGGPESKKPKPTTDRLDWSIRRANIAKPQELFEHKPDNFAAGPWKPLLTTKPHAKVPLDESLATFVDENQATQYRHPYETEITEMHYPSAVYHKADPILYQPTETTAAVWVDTWEGVLAMLKELRAADVIAVDLEHHDFRTYTGLLSLMQISTRDKDWVVDTLQPWRQRLEILNEVFADPAKIKVFHGATSDIVWLQRDLGLYIVGLFDTYFACDCLVYPARSLAYLLKRFVDFDADKKYQMADWRIRPLPEEMLYYARSDTHYLLYVYDMVRNELAEQSDRSEGAKPEADLTEYVLQKSKETSLLRHETLLCDAETGLGSRGWLNTLMRTYSSLNGEQFSVFKALFQWRDNLARRLDESPGYLMPIRTLGDIAKILPPDRKAMWSLLHNTARETKSEMDAVFLLIQQARERGANGPTSGEFLRSAVVLGAKVPASWHQGKFGPLAGGGAASASPASKGKDLDKLPDISELRSGVSQLWGAKPISSSKKAEQGGEEGEADHTDAHLDTPWFSFVQAAVTAGILSPSSAAEATAAKRQQGQEDEADGDYIAFPAAGTPTTTKSAPAVLAEEQAADEAEKAKADKARVDKARAEKAAAREEVFTLKGGKRGGNKDASSSSGKKKADAKGSKKGKDKKGKNKAAATESQPPTSDSDGGGAPVAVSSSDDGEEDDESEEVVPFNFDTAGSVLHAKKPSSDPRGGRGGGGGSHGKKATFDPYRAKANAEGPKAARRMHFEKTGKSGTFKK